MVIGVSRVNRRSVMGHFWGLKVLLFIDILNKVRGCFWIHLYKTLR